MPTKNKKVNLSGFKTGGLVDNRPKEKKQKDFDPREAFASAAPLDWREKTIEEVEAEIMATSISQHQTFRCVSEYAGIFFEWAEYLENGVRKIFSRRDVYGRRFNFPGGGMMMHDLFKIMREGSCLEEQLPSTASTEKQINLPYEVTADMKAIRATHAADTSFTWDTWTIDDLAQMIEQKIPQCLFWYFDNNTRNEWWNKSPKVVTKKIDLYAEDTGRHQATGVSYLLKDGKKCIAVMDSAGQGTGLGKQKNIRFVSEDFIKARNYAAGFAIDKKNLDYKPIETIRYTFMRNLKNGDNGEDVKILQKILVLEGCLAIKTPTLLYRGMTEMGVKKLQEKYAKEILAPLGLKIGTGMFWDATRKFINKKYGV
jgi:hypothetical protein